jgi:hypothetical protein
MLLLCVRLSICGYICINDVCCGWCWHVKMRDRCRQRCGRGCSALASLANATLSIDTTTNLRSPRQRPGIITAAMGRSQAPFRFLDLPKEVRLVIYERLPRCFRRHEMAIYSQHNGEVPQQKLTVVLKTVPMAMLSTCRQINSEASAIVQGIARRVILLQPPQLIFEAQDHYNETFLFWILDAMSEQAHRRVLGGIRHTLDRTGDGKFQL